jgi:hypothetical protein
MYLCRALAFQAENEKPCQLHANEDSCKLPEPLDIDLLVASSTCQPYSLLRQGCGPSDPRKHKTFYVSFGDENSVMSLNKRVLPAVSLSENVTNMRSPYNKATVENGADDFVSRMMEIQRSDGSQHFAACATFTLDSHTFVEGTRERCSFPIHPFPRSSGS